MFLLVGTTILLIIALTAPNLMEGFAFIPREWLRYFTNGGLSAETMTFDVRTLIVVTLVCQLGFSLLWNRMLRLFFGPARRKEPPKTIVEVCFLAFLEEIIFRLLLPLANIPLHMGSFAFAGMHFANWKRFNPLRVVPHYIAFYLYSFMFFNVCLAQPDNPNAWICAILATTITHAVNNLVAIGYNQLFEPEVYEVGESCEIA